MNPLLLGMCNTLSDDPEFDLYPYPEGSTGWRLWKMLPEGTTRKQYLDAFDRRNLLRGREWDRQAARRAARGVLSDLLERRYDYVVVLGTEVRAALGLPPHEPLSCQWYVVSGVGPEPDAVVLVRHFAWFAFPHPSGRNRWFNDAANYAKARELLGALMRGDFHP